MTTPQPNKPKGDAEPESARERFEKKVSELAAANKAANDGYLDRERLKQEIYDFLMADPGLSARLAAEDVIEAFLQEKVASGEILKLSEDRVIRASDATPEHRRQAIEFMQRQQEEEAQRYADSFKATTQNKTTNQGGKNT